MSNASGTSSQLTFRMPVDATSKVVTWFTDRPERDAGIMKLSEFVAQWSKGGGDGFKSDPPNVSIIYGTDEKPLTMIATMSDVQIVGTGSGQVLQATMTVVPEDTRVEFSKSESHLAAHAKRATTSSAAPAAGLTKKVAVFVDPEIGLTDS